MSNMSKVKKLCITGFCVALCYVLPPAFHAVGLGTTFSPLHIPPLLCGVACGGWYGAVCGLVGPVLSSILGSMPPAARLPFMVPELVTYGLVSGVLFRFIRTGKTWLDLYLSLIPAMLAGRVAGGIAQAIFLLSAAKEYSIAMWASGYLVATLPGAVLHCVVIPAVVLTMMKAGLVPARYGKEKTSA